MPILGNGLDEEKVEKICYVLKVECEDCDFIPKKAADKIMDLIESVLVKNRSIKRIDDSELLIGKD